MKKTSFALVVLAFVLQILFPSLLILNGCLCVAGFIAFMLSCREKREEKEVVLELLSEGVVFLSSKGRVEYVNPVAQGLFKEVKGKLVGECLPENTLLGMKAKALLQTATNMQIPVTDSIALGEEKRQFLHLLAVPARRGSVLVLQDVSSQQKILEVGRDFVANASHELKTPITVIRGFTETLQDMPDLPREMVEEILEKIVRSCQRMNGLVRNLLMLSDIENIPLLSCAPCDVMQILQECERATQVVHSSANIHIKGPKECVVEVEEGIFELALLNLFDNAAKYSPSSAQIDVEVTQEEKGISIRIADKGAGIPKEDLEHIFDRFYTVNKAHSRKLGGAGLGLSLVKKIIDKHEGNLSVDSTFGEGTTFRILLPRR